MRGVTRPGRRLSGHIQTIRVRLTLWYVALLALILVGFSAFLYLRLAQTLRDQTDNTLTLDAQRVVGTLDIQNGAPALGDAPNRLPSGMLVVLFDPAGRRLGATNVQAALPEPAASLQRARQGVSGLATLPIAGEDWRVLTLPVVEQGRLVAILEVGQSEQPAEAALRQLALLMALAIPGTLVLAVAGGLFLAGRALDPIDNITREAGRIGAEDLSRRLHLPASADEVGRLAATFDRMLDRLEGAFVRQRQFTADASHELRTPLALLTSQAEVALERSRKPAEYRQALQEIQDEARRMGQLLSELLTLARADSGREVIAQEPVALAELAADVADAMSPLAERHGVSLALAERQPCDVIGDQTRLTQLLVNLVDNALKYTPVDGSVRMDVRRQGRWAVVSVADTGIGIAPEHLPHLFERFYRVDQARTREEGGAGLGLSIAEWIAHSHGGEIEATSMPGAGSTFTVRLPLAPTAN